MEDSTDHAIARPGDATSLLVHTPTHMCSLSRYVCVTNDTQGNHSSDSFENCKRLGPVHTSLPATQHLENPAKCPIAADSAGRSLSGQHPCACAGSAVWQRPHLTRHKSSRLDAHPPHASTPPASRQHPRHRPTDQLLPSTVYSYLRALEQPVATHPPVRRLRRPHCPERTWSATSPSTTALPQKICSSNASGAARCASLLLCPASIPQPPTEGQRATRTMNARRSSPAFPSLLCLRLYSRHGRACPISRLTDLTIENPPVYNGHTCERLKAQV